MRRQLVAIGIALAVAACGSAPATFVADGELDCVDDLEWTEQGQVPEGTGGLGSQSAAVDAYLTPFLEKNGGEIVMVDATSGSLIVDNAEVVHGIASEMPSGGWLVLTGSGCDGFDR